MTRTPTTIFAFAAYSTVTMALLIASADLAAAPRRTMGAAGQPTRPGMATAMAPGMTPGMTPAMGAGMQPGPDRPPNGASVDPPPPDEVLQPEEHVYRPVRLEVRKIVWFAPGQRGLMEAHPLVMGLAAMALATVTLLFFFLRGVKRPKDGDI